MYRLSCLACLSVVLVLPSLTAGQTSDAFLWTATGGMQDLGRLQGWQDSVAYAANRSGAVVGCNGKDVGSEAAFGWTSNRGMRLLNGLSPTDSCARGINNAGQVVGFSQTANGETHAFLWARGSAPQDLGTLGGPTSIATAINNSGEVVGYSEATNGVTHAFLWSRNTGMQDLESISSRSCPTCESRAWAIDDAGIIAGQMGAHDGGIQWAIVWRNGHTRNLGELGNSGGNHGSAAFGINKSGEVVGSSTTSSGDVHAFLWSEAGGMQDLGTLPGSTTSIAQGVNSSGQVVGYSYTPGEIIHAFIWSGQAGMTDLGTLGGAGAAAYAINDAGEVTGSANTQ